MSSYAKEAAEIGESIIKAIEKAVKQNIKKYGENPNVIPCVVAAFGYAARVINTHTDPDFISLVSDLLRRMQMS